MLAIGPLEPSVSAFSVLRLQMGATKPSMFSNGFWGSNSNPHVTNRAASTALPCLLSWLAPLTPTPGFLLLPCLQRIAFEEDAQALEVIYPRTQRSEQYKLAPPQTPAPTVP